MDKLIELENRVAQLEAKLETKKEDIQDINKELISERNTMVAVREDVAEMKVLLNEWHTENKENLKQINDLQIDVNNSKTEIKRLYGIIDTLKFVIGLVFGSGVFISFIITKMFG